MRHVVSACLTNGLVISRRFIIGIRLASIVGQRTFVGVDCVISCLFGDGHGHKVFGVVHHCDPAFAPRSPQTLIDLALDPPLKTHVANIVLTQEAGEPIFPVLEDPLRLVHIIERSAYWTRRFRGLATEFRRRPRFAY